MVDSDSTRCAGIYTFADRDTAEAYLRSELFQTAIAQNPAIVNVRTRGGALLEGPRRQAGLDVTDDAPCLRRIGDDLAVVD